MSSEGDLQPEGVLVRLIFDVVMLLFAITCTSISSEFIRVTICFVEKFMPSMLQRFQKNQKQDNVHIQLGKECKG